MAPNFLPVRVLDHPEATSVVVVGCGGTGGYVAKAVCRLLHGLEATRAQEEGRGPHRWNGRPAGWVGPVVLADGDVVTEGNLARQDFAPCDLGRSKALVLAERYAGHFRLEVAAHPRYLDEKTAFKQVVPEGSIVVGCVDNAATRRLLHARLSSYNHVVYLDAGNSGVEEDPDDPIAVRESGWGGQAVCGVRKRGSTIMPLPAEAFPDLVEGEDPIPNAVPCGQAVVSQPQRQMTNLLAATTVMQYLTTLLTDGTLLHHRSFFDARAGWVKSYPATGVLSEVAA